MSGLRACQISYAITRQADGLGLLHSGLVRALRYAEAVGALTAEQAAHWRATGWQVMLRLAEKQTDIVSQENPVRKYATILREQIAQGKLYSKRRGKAAEDADDIPLYLGSPDGEFLGWHDREHFDFLPSAAYHRVAQYAREEGRYFGVKENDLRRGLAEEGILVAEDGRFTTTLRVDGQVHRVLRLRREPLEQLWNR